MRMETLCIILTDKKNKLFIVCVMNLHSRMNKYCLGIKQAAKQGYDSFVSTPLAVLFMVQYMLLY